MLTTRDNNWSPRHERAEAAKAETRSLRGKRKGCRNAEREGGEGGEKEILYIIKRNYENEFGRPTARDKALRDNIDQNYEVLLLYYSNRSRSLVCCIFHPRAAPSAFMPGAVVAAGSIFHSLQRAASYVL